MQDVAAVRLSALQYYSLLLSARSPCKLGRNRGVASSHCEEDDGMWLPVECMP